MEGNRSPHPDWGLVVDPRPALLSDKFELVLFGSLLILVKIVVEGIIVPVGLWGIGGWDRHLGSLAFLDVDWEGSGESGVLVAVVSDGMSCRQASSHERLQLCRTQEVLVLLLNVQYDLSSPSEGVAPRVREHFERIARGRRGEGVLNGVRVGRRDRGEG